MEKVTVHSGKALPLRYSDVDTDQIIPAVYLKRVSRTGFEDGLFAAWRSDPDFVLNRSEHEGATVLVAGPNFGTGSSREHAVWALLDYGFRVVIGSGFGDIFRGNAGKAGLLVATVDPTIIGQLWELVEAAPDTNVTVDLVECRISAESTAGAVSASFDIDAYTRWRLLEGLDDVGITLSHGEVIDSYERDRPARKPTTLPART